MIISGKNPVFEAVNAGKCKKIFIREGTKFNIRSFLNVPYEILNSQDFDKIYGRKIQGIAAEIDFKYFIFEDNVDEIIESGRVVILDQIMDPQNFGAIIRAAHCFGFNYIIVAKNNQSPVTQTVFKASAGSLFYVKIINVVNLARTIDALKEKGFYIYAADVNGKSTLKNSVFKEPMGIIIGSEGKGIRPNVLKRADMTFKIPMDGRIDSLNASQSASIVFYELYKNYNC